MRLTGGLLDRRAICQLSSPFSGPPIYRVDLGVGGPSFTATGWRYRPDIGAMKECFRFLICCSVGDQIPKMVKLGKIYDFLTPYKNLGRDRGAVLATI